MKTATIGRGLLVALLIFGGHPPVAAGEAAPPEAPKLPPTAGIETVAVADSAARALVAPRVGAISVADLKNRLRISASGPPAEPLVFYSPSPAPAIREMTGIRRIQLNRKQSTWKGAALSANVAGFFGALGAAYGLIEEKDAAWIAGGAAALGALYGATRGYDQPGWRTETKWVEPKISVRVNASENE